MPKMKNGSLILDHLNPSQQAAVQHGEGPLLILAGPGSGKTRALTHRAAFLIQNKGIKVDNILLLTFTNKAADEMKTRLKKLLVPATPRRSPPQTNTIRGVAYRTIYPPNNLPFAGTFHSFCSRVLRQNGHHLGIPPGFTIYDTSDQKDAIKQAMQQLDFSDKKLAPTAVLKTISQAKNELITALEYPQYSRGFFQENVSQIYLAYEKILNKHHALDFDDLLLKTVRLFQKFNPILTSYQNQFHYILVDEYQDTNQAQYTLTRQLSAKRRNLCVVGDASQAIYGFRGANYHNLLSLQSDFKDLKTISLEQNYRSTQTILNAANSMIKKNTSHPVLNLWTQNNPGEPVSLYQASSELDEAAFIINLISGQLLSQQNTFDRYAVLYRTNAQSRVLEEAFLHAGLPYRLASGTHFYERKEIKDCLGYLKYWANPQDQVAFKRIEKIGKRRLAKFLKLFEQTKKQPSTLKLLNQVLKVTGYLDLFDPKNEADLNRLENIKELRSVARQYPDLTAFLENVTLIEREYSPNGQPNGVTLMTVHSAKGTEFPVVFVTGLEEGLFPHTRSLLEKEKIEEERRLFYVAMTRAKQKLYLLCAQKRLFFGHFTRNPISRFVEDIPEELIKFENDLLE